MFFLIILNKPDVFTGWFKFVWFWSDFSKTSLSNASSSFVSSIVDITAIDNYNDNDSEEINFFFISSINGLIILYVQ